MLPGDTQVLIAEKPSTFFPEGFHRAYSWTKCGHGSHGRPRRVRPRRRGDPRRTRAGCAGSRAAEQGAAGAPAVPAIPPGAGLLSEQQILDFAAPGRWGPSLTPTQPRGGAGPGPRLHQAARGEFPADLAFDNQLGRDRRQLGARLGGDRRQLRRRTPAFRLFRPVRPDSQNRGGQSVRQRPAGRTVLETTDSAARLGSLQINADHTYVWNVRDDGTVLRGTWRELARGRKAGLGRRPGDLAAERARRSGLRGARRPAAKLRRMDRRRHRQGPHRRAIRTEDVGPLRSRGGRDFMKAQRLEAFTDGSSSRSWCSSCRCRGRPAGRR